MVGWLGGWEVDLVMGSLLCCCVWAEGLMIVCLRGCEVDLVMRWLLCCCLLG